MVLLHREAVSTYSRVISNDHHSSFPFVLNRRCEFILIRSRATDLLDLISYITKLFSQKLKERMCLFSPKCGRIWTLSKSHMNIHLLLMEMYLIPIHFNLAWGSQITFALQSTFLTLAPDNSQCARTMSILQLSYSLSNYSHCLVFMFHEQTFASHFNYWVYPLCLRNCFTDIRCFLNSSVREVKWQRLSFEDKNILPSIVR